MFNINEYRKEEEYRDIVGVWPIEGSYDEKRWTIPDRDMAFPIPFEDIDPDILETYGLQNQEDLVAMGVPRRRKVGQEILDRLLFTASFGNWDPRLRDKTQGIQSSDYSVFGDKSNVANLPSLHVPPGYGPHGYFDEDIAQTAKDTLWIDQPQSLLNYAKNNPLGIGQQGTGDNPSLSDYSQY